MRRAGQARAVWRGDYTGRLAVGGQAEPAARNRRDVHRHALEGTQGLGVHARGPPLVDGLGHGRLQRLLAQAVHAHARTWRGR